MSNYTTNSDIVNAALFTAGEAVDGSSEYEAKALEYYNRCHMAIASGGMELDKDVDEVWWWLRSSTPHVITMEPVIEDGTLDVLQGDENVVFSVAPTKSLAGWFLRVDGSQDVFRVLTHIASDPNAVLDGVFTGPTNTADGYEVFKLEYDIPDNVMEIIQPMRVYQEGKDEITGMEMEALEERYPLSQAWVGVPEAFAMVGQRRVRFSHQGGATAEDLIRIDFDYLILPVDLLKDASEPLVPREFRRVLADYTAFFLLLDKDDNKAKDVGTMAKAGLQAMQKENRRRSVRFSDEYGAIRPRTSHQAHHRAPLRTTGGRIIGVQ